MPTLLFDLSALIGVALFAFGLGWIYPPLFPLFAGAMITAAAVLGARGSKKCS